MRRAQEGLALDFYQWQTACQSGVSQIWDPRFPVGSRLKPPKRAFILRNSQAFPLNIPKRGAPVLPHPAEAEQQAQLAATAKMEDGPTR